jgi:hypothetical protein
MSQSLQNQILYSKTMQGIIELTDGAGTTISNGNIVTTNINSNSISTNGISLNGVLDLNNSLELEQYDDISTSVGNVSLWEKGNSYFSYLPKSLATPSLSSHLITKGYSDATYAPTGSYASLSASNTFTGTTNTFNGNFVANCATSTGLIEGRINGVTVFAIGSFALGAPLSIAYGSGIDQITFNVPPVFKSDIILDNGYTFNAGTPYGLGNIYVYWGTIQIQDNSGLNPAFYGHFETNTIEPTYTARNASFYTTFGNSQTLTFGNSATSNALSIQFANTTFNRPITILDNITTNSLTVTPTQLSFLNNVSSGKIGQSQITNGYVDLNSNQTIGGIKNFSNVQIQNNQTYTANLSTLSLIGAKNVFLNASTLTTFYLPQPSATDIGKVFTIIKGGGTASWDLAIVRAVGTTFTITVDANSANTSYTMFQNETSIDLCVIASGTTGSCYQIYNNTATTIRAQTVFTNAFFLPSQSNIPPSKSNITTVMIGYGALTGIGGNLWLNLNTVVGSYIANSATTAGNGNTLMGCEAYKLTTTLGNYNTAVGYRAGYTYQSTGANNTLIGSLTDFNGANAFNNSTALGTGAIITGSNQVVLGTTNETTILPSTKIQFGGSHLFNSVFQTINNTSIDWNTTPPTNFPRYILFSSSSATNVVLTLPQISNANVYEGMEFIFRRTNTFASSTTTAILQVQRGGTTDTIYGIGVMTTGNTVNVLGNNAYYGKIVCVNKTTSPFNWAYFPS